MSTPSARPGDGPGGGGVLTACMPLHVDMLGWQIAMTLRHVEVLHCGAPAPAGSGPPSPRAVELDAHARHMVVCDKSAPGLDGGGVPATTPAARAAIEAGAVGGNARTVGSDVCATWRRHSGRLSAAASAVRLVASASAARLAAVGSSLAAKAGGSSVGGEAVGSGVGGEAVGSGVGGKAVSNGVGGEAGGSGVGGKPVGGRQRRRRQGCCRQPWRWGGRQRRRRQVCSKAVGSGVGGEAVSSVGGKAVGSGVGGRAVGSGVGGKAVGSGVGGETAGCEAVGGKAVGCRQRRRHWGLGSGVGGEAVGRLAAAASAVGLVAAASAVRLSGVRPSAVIVTTRLSAVGSGVGIWASAAASAVGLQGCRRRRPQ